MRYLSPYNDCPSKKNMQKVIDRFKTILPYTKRNSLNMGVGRVWCSKAVECGSPHCVGGWYSVASRNRKVPRRFRIGGAGKGYYLLGAEFIAMDLGFESSEALRIWAAEHPKIWGNIYGSLMFHSPSAYENAKTMRGVVRFLEGVMRRLPK